MAAAQVEGVSYPVPEVAMSRYISSQRRRLLGWLALLPFVSTARAQQQRLVPTPAQTEGRSTRAPSPGSATAT